MGMFLKEQSINPRGVFSTPLVESENLMLYLYVKNLGFVMDFDQSGPTLKFVMDPWKAQPFDTVQQVNVIIKANFLHAGDCTMHGDFLPAVAPKVSLDF
jgi:hypothetical protein